MWTLPIFVYCLFGWLLQHPFDCPPPTDCPSACQPVSHSFHYYLFATLPRQCHTHCGSGSAHTQMSHTHALTHAGWQSSAACRLGEWHATFGCCKWCVALNLQTHPANYDTAGGATEMNTYQREMRMYTHICMYVCLYVYHSVLCVMSTYCQCCGRVWGVETVAIRHYFVASLLLSPIDTGK